ncbi:MAG TPA: hypothetical protein VEW25_12295 [Allosphingosinicella sp.]|nr:hypothetical protein [Allosphingosinicella sp.]
MRKIAVAAAALGLGIGLGSGSAQAQAPAHLLAAVQGPTVTRDFLIGRWTDTNNCAVAVDFLPDGRFRTTAGAEGRWTLQGGRLSFIGHSTVTATVRATNRDAITLTHGDGTVGASTRCAPRTPAAMPPLPATAADVLRIGGPVTRNLLFGVWTDNGDCNVTIQFFRDGRFTVPTGNGRWTLSGDRLSFIGASTVTARVRAVGRDRILLIHQDGTIGQSVRC